MQLLELTHCLAGEAVKVETGLTCVKYQMWPCVGRLASELRVEIEVKICPWSSRIAWRYLVCIFLKLKTYCLARNMGTF